MPTLRIDDELDLYYEEQGAGRTIVFVHGVWMSGRYFQRQLETLSEDHHVVTIDLRGHGRSSHSESGHTMATYAHFSGGQGAEGRGAVRLVHGLHGGLGILRAIWK